MSQFSISRNGQLQPAPKGAKEVPIKGYEGFQFFALRQPIPGQREGSDSKAWCVYEARSGKAISWGDTLARAVEWTKTFLDQFGGPDWLTAQLSTSTAKSLFDGVA